MRDVGCGPGGLDLPADGFGVVALVSQHDAEDGQMFEQQRAGLAVGGLPAGQQEGERAVEAIGEGVDLGRAPAARAADGLALLPPLPPAAQQCAFTVVVSISTWEGRPPACASVSNKPTPTPLAAQRTKRL